MGSVTGIRGVSNKIRKIKRIARSLEDAEKEFKIEVDKIVDELEQSKKELQAFFDALRKGE